MTSAFYTTEDIARAFRALGIGAGDCVYLTGNFGALGFHESKSKPGTLDAHVQALRLVTGESGTLIVPTHTFYLCNTDTVFDPQTSASERGPFTEHLRRQPGAVRQFHPFASLTALGARAQTICGNTTRHAYGPNTPYDRLLAADAWGVSVAMPPQRTCSVIHHVEQEMAVPYRYTKEFLHPVRRGDKVQVEPFYLFVTYRGIEIVRDRNEKLFQHPLLAAELRQAPLGASRVWAYRMRTLRAAAMELMSADIYAWLREPPLTRPYQG